MLDILLLKQTKQQQRENNGKLNILTVRTKIAVPDYNCANPRSLTDSLPFPSNIHNIHYSRRALLSVTKKGILVSNYLSFVSPHFFSITEESMQPRPNPTPPPPSHIVLWFQLTNSKIFICFHFQILLHYCPYPYLLASS